MLDLDGKKFNRADEENAQEKLFKIALKDKLEAAGGGSGGGVATIQGEPAIWLGYGEAKTIQLSKQKTAVRLSSSLLHFYSILLVLLDFCSSIP